MKKKFTITIEENLLKEVKVKAEKECWSISAKIEKYLRSLL